MSTQNPVGLVDMDGTLAGFQQRLYEDMKGLCAPCELPLPDDLWELEDEPYFAKRMSLIKSIPGWWRNLPRIEEGFLVMEMARSVGYDIHILTKGPKLQPAAWAEKLEWCQAQPEITQSDGITITFDKGLVWGTFLFDDYPNYMLKWLEHRPRGLGIMPVTAYNGEFQHPQVVMWDGRNVDQVHEALEIAYRRQPMEELILPQ